MAGRSSIGRRLVWSCDPSTVAIALNAIQASTAAARLFSGKIIKMGGTGAGARDPGPKTGRPAAFSCLSGPVESPLSKDAFPRPPV